MGDKVIVTFINNKKNIKVDLEVPTDITTIELLKALNYAFDLEVDTSDINTQFFRIGTNGIQIFLGDGFYFTAARTSDGPVISFAGKVNNVMKYFKVDQNGMIIDGATIS